MEESYAISPRYSGDKALVIENARGTTVGLFMRRLGYWYRKECWRSSELGDLYLINVNYRPISVDASKHEAELEVFLGAEDARGPRGERRGLHRTTLLMFLGSIYLRGLKTET